MKEWKPPERNWDNIQFGELRKLVDLKFNEAHDVLSGAYYGEKPFIWKGKDWGVLDKVFFDKLHSLIFHLRLLVFHQTNMELSLEKMIPEEEYNYIFDGKGNIVGKRTDKSAAIIDGLKAKEIELEI